MNKKILCIILTAVLYWWPLMAGCTANKNTQAPPPTVNQDTQTDKDLGSKENPVKCDKEKGEKEYLDKLREMDGNPVTYERTGHLVNAAGVILDEFEVKSSDEKTSVIIYMNMYCPGQSETQAINGFQMVSPVIPQPTVTSQIPPTNPTVTAGGTPANVSNQTPPAAASPSPQTPQTQPQPPQTPAISPDERIPGFDDVPEPSGKKTSNPTSTPQPANAGNSGVPGTPGAPKTSGGNTGQGQGIPGFDDVPDSSKATPSAPTSIPSTPKKSQAQVDKKYVSLVPILDKNKTVSTKTSDNKIPGLITSAFTNAFTELIKKSNAPLTINQKGHTVHDNPKQAAAFLTICESADPDIQKLEKINTQILTPGKIDLIVAALFSSDEKNKQYKVIPILAGKADKKLFMPKKFTYDFNMKPGEIEKDFKNKMISLIQAEFPAILQAPPAAANQQSNPPQPPLYISIIPLDIPIAPAQQKPKSLSGLLNDVIEKGVKVVESNNRQVSVNEAKHTIHDSGPAVKDLNTILARTDLMDNQKAEKIIAEIMNSHGIDCIYTAQLTEMNQSDIVNIHLYAIGKARKKVFTTNLIFQKDELICEESGTKQSMICQVANDNIGNAVQTLLEQALK